MKLGKTQQPIPPSVSPCCFLPFHSLLLVLPSFSCLPCPDRKREAPRSSGSGVWTPAERWSRRRGAGGAEPLAGCFMLSSLTSQPCSFLTPCSQPPFFQQPRAWRLRVGHLSDDQQKSLCTLVLAPQTLCCPHSSKTDSLGSLSVPAPESCDPPEQVPLLPAYTRGPYLPVGVARAMSRSSSSSVGLLDLIRQFDRNVYISAKNEKKKKRCKSP